MIPFRDDVPSVTYPVMTILLIVANVVVFLYQLSLPLDQLESFILLNGVVPARLADLSSQPVAVMAETGRSLLTSIFLHGGWLHLGGNMLYLWVFGDNIEDRMGHLRFLLFYLLCGAAASVVHLTANWDSAIPAIGASGAVAGVLGAYLVCHPFARISTIIPLLLFWPIVELPALLVLGSWFFIQLLYGVATIGVSAQSTGIAWWSHIGGFVAGLLLLRWFARPRPRHYQYRLPQAGRRGGFIS